ncbi:unnamed protein product, partial [Phaeothamnion confervicola]
MSAEEIDVSGVALPIETGSATPETAGSRLEVVKDGEVVESFDVGSRPVTVLGRNSRMSHIVTLHQSTSRRHAAVVHDGAGGVFLVDFGSQHGSRVNSKDVVAHAAQRLADGDVIALAESSRGYVVRLGGIGSRSGAGGGAAASAAPAAAAANGGPAAAKARASAAAAAAKAAAVPAAGASGRGGCDWGRKAKDDDPVAETPEEGRRRRAAEIAAMTASLSAPPTFTPTPRAPGSDDEDGADNDGRKNRHQKGGGVEGDEGDGGSGGESGADGEEIEVQEDSEADRLASLVRRLELPISHEAVLRGHAKQVTALAVDAGGGRLATGGSDCVVKLWDFGGMDSAHRSFREVTPEEGTVIVALAYSPNGDRFLACTAGVQPKVYSRDATLLATFVGGDRYLKDMSHTKGHVTRVTGGQWHPTRKDWVMTSSVDGTVRLWDLNTRENTFDNLHCRSVTKLKNQRGLKASATAAALSPDGSLAGAGDDEGSFHLFQLDRPHARPQVVRGAHSAGSTVTAVEFHEDGHLLATRATDSTVALWDARRLKDPMKRFLDIETVHETSNVSFGPDGRTLVAGCNVNPRSEEAGTLRFFELYTSETTPVAHIGIAGVGVGVIRVVWHHKLKQVFATTTAGSTKILYDPAVSSKGAMMTAARHHRAASSADAAFGFGAGISAANSGAIRNPGALPMYAQDHQSKRRREEKDRKDPKRSKKPDVPIDKGGFQGRVSSSFNFTQYVSREKLVPKTNIRSQVTCNATSAVQSEGDDDGGGSSACGVWCCPLAVAAAVLVGVVLCQKAAVLPFFSKRVLFPRFGAYLFICRALRFVCHLVTPIPLFPHFSTHSPGRTPIPASPPICFRLRFTPPAFVSVSVQDPREELLKYADTAAADPQFLGGAYGKTQ